MTDSDAQLLLTILTKKFDLDVVQDTLLGLLRREANGGAPIQDLVRYALHAAKVTRAQRFRDHEKGHVVVPFTAQEDSLLAHTPTQLRAAEAQEQLDQFPPRVVMMALTQTFQSATARSQRYRAIKKLKGRER